MKMSIKKICSEDTFTFFNIFEKHFLNVFQLFTCTAATPLLSHFCFLLAIIILSSSFNSQTSFWWFKVKNAIIIKKKKRRIQCSTLPEHLHQQVPATSVEQTAGDWVQQILMLDLYFHWEQNQKQWTLQEFLCFPVHLNQD